MAPTQRASARIAEAAAAKAGVPFHSSPPPLAGLDRGDDETRRPSKRRKTTATTATTAGAATMPKTSAGKTAKLTVPKKTAKPTHYTCTSCYAVRTARKFREYNPSNDCKHLINTCAECLSMWLSTRIDNADFVIVPASNATAPTGVVNTGGVNDGNVSTGKPDAEVNPKIETDSQEMTVLGLRCPECDVVLDEVEVRSCTTTAAGVRFKELNRKHIAETNKGWIWCLAPRCRAGQIHHLPATSIEDDLKSTKEEPTNPKTSAKKGRKKPAAAATEPTLAQVAQQKRDRLVECYACSAQACASCVRPWHEGETCENYQLRIKDRVAEEEAALKMLVKVAKKCPGCAVNIQRNGGCPYMNCTRCHVAFCWNCLQKFGGVHGGYCKCNPRPPPPPLDVQAARLPAEALRQAQIMRQTFQETIQEIRRHL